MSARVRTIAIRRRLAVLGIVSLAAAPAGVTGHTQIVIEPGAVAPQVVRVPVEDRITFVNRSGEVIHLDFLGDDGGHHVFQVPGEIWAVVHRPGTHPYVVHFEARGGKAIRGEIQAVETPEALPPTCPRLSVMGVCLER